MSEHCPTCREPVLLTPDGRALETQPHRLGINLPDGRQLTTTEAAIQAASVVKPPRGYRMHRCPQPEQMGLFGGGQ